jgi:hypothetical protein
MKGLSLIAPGSGGFEQLDRIARRIIDQNLPSSFPDHDLVAEPASCTPQLLDGD